MLRLLISTGEVSGDLQGSLLIKALYEEASRRSVELDLVALGGPRMKAAGAELLADTAHMGAIGLLEAIPFVLPTLRVQSKVDTLLKNRPPDGLVLIDYMGPNIRLGKKLRRLLPSVPITYYIAPQEWAWRVGDGGTTDLIGFTDKILAIFQTEADFYAKRGANVKWIGHPMLDMLRNLPEKESARKRLGLLKGQKLLLLLPASRSQELRYVMPVLSKAAAMLQKHDSSIKVFVPSGLPGFEKSLREALELEGVLGTVVSSSQWDSLKPALFAAADLALGKSGTVNMELALHGVPQIAGYRVSRFTAFIARRLLNFQVEHISPVNLLLKERLVAELVQEEFTPEAIFELAIPLLENMESRNSIFHGYKRLRAILGDPGVTQRAAKAILDSF